MNSEWKTIGRLLSLFTILHSLFSPIAGAQTVSLPSAVYRPGRYLPLRVEADAAGPVRVSGPNVQAVDWPAPGRGGATVPLLVYGGVDGLTLSINGKPVRLDLHALGDDDADPADLQAFWQTIDPRPPRGPMVDDDAYALAGLWRPGRSAGVRRWTLLATLAAVLTLAVARHADPKRATGWLLVAGGGLAVGIAAFYPADVARRELRAEGQPGWRWVWFAGDGPSGTEPWTPGLRFVPRTADASDAANPVLACDAAGRPTGIRAAIRPGERAVFLRPL